MKSQALLSVYMRREIRRVGTAGLLSMLSSVLGALLPVFAARFYEMTFEYRSFRAGIFDAIPAALTPSPLAVAAWFGALVCVRLLLEHQARSQMITLGEHWAAFLREQLFQKQLAIPQKIYDRKGHARYVGRWHGDLNDLRNLLTLGYIRAGSDALLLLLLGLLLAQIDWRLPASLAGGMLLIALPAALLQGRLQDVSHRQRKRQGRLARFVQVRLSAMATVKAFNRHTPETEAFQRRHQKAVTENLSYQQARLQYQMLGPAGVYLTLLVAMLLFSAAPVEGRIPKGDLLAGFLVLVTAVPVVRRLGASFSIRQAGKHALERVRKLLEAEEESRETLPALKFRKGEIRLQRAGQSLRIPGGSLFWVTPGLWDTPLLAEELTLLHPPAPGRIFLDGQDISQVEPFSLRKRVAAVSPSQPLLGRTVEEALVYSGRRDRSTEVQAWLDRLQQHLPLSLRLRPEDPIGEQARLLLPVQQKILMYIRAFLTGKPVMVIESPWESLDPGTCAELAEVFGEMSGKHTLILTDWQGSPQAQPESERLPEPTAPAPPPAFAPAPPLGGSSR
jgi:ABC-type multidrug transport system fused ATPase/permease subunit